MAQKVLRLILGDQLNHQHSWFKGGAAAHKDATYVMLELRQETDYVHHHVQKVVAFFLAMRAFAAAKEVEGFNVRYLKLDDEKNSGDLGTNLEGLVKDLKIERFEYMLPDEYRLDVQLSEIAKGLDLPYGAVDSEHFLVERGFLEHFFKGKKTYLMENFYRQLRKDFDLLMDGKDPETGQWNYDADNRKKYDEKVAVPVLPSFNNKDEAEEIVTLLEKAGVKTMGRFKKEDFNNPITREEALQLLNHFVQEVLPHFGTYEDAMDKRHPNLFHSRLSFAMNVKLLSPMEVVNAAIKAYRESDGKISIAQVEGFVRQIVGWREYMRGIYWAKMPEFASLNYFNHTREMPDWYWTGETKMLCLKDGINNSLDYAYAHHIQRLMVIGNFALLAGINPTEVDAWYLGVYIDAIEWVEITNTRGMSQFADGGIVGTKPYVSSANYINKMSNYCGSCHYNAKLRHGEKACPFNSLYWHFYHRHSDKLAKNPRIGMAYQGLKKMSEDELNATLAQAEKYLKEINSL